MKGQKKGNF